MKIAYLDCASGISGDMMLAALVDAGVDLATIEEGVQSLGLPDCRFVVSRVLKKGFRATHIVVEHPAEHAHRHLSDIVGMIDHGDLTDSQRDLAKQIFQKLAEAEAHVHGTTVDKVHFHEVGAVDSIADIVGTAIGWSLLGVERAVASPVPTGHGFVEIAHGRCPIPAPATAVLLRSIPLAESKVEGELTTPTGAAILATLVDAFGPLPSMTIDAIGCGAGSRDYTEQANLLRLLVGTAGEPTRDNISDDDIWTLETNLDDMTGELIGYTTDCLWEAGALDVFTTAIQMKKNRPAVKLTVLCRQTQLTQIESVLFCETTTLGVRRWRCQRSTLPRQTHLVTTEWGEVAGVRFTAPDGRVTFSPEFESCRRVAAEHQIPLKAVYESAQRAFGPDKS